jgi:hypothetical protein
MEWRQHQVASSRKGQRAGGAILSVSPLAEDRAVLNDVLDPALWRVRLRSDVRTLLRSR